jgi:hypothetical protein
MCAWPSSSTVTLSMRSCTSISSVSDSIASCGGLSLGGEVVRLLCCCIGDGSGETLETLDIVVMDTSRRAGGCFGGAEGPG